MNEVKVTNLAEEDLDQPAHEVAADGIDFELGPHEIRTFRAS